MGGRAYQEDRLVAVVNVDGKDQHFFAVFDGHGGSLVSDYLSKNFHTTLFQHQKIKNQPITALQECWAVSDEQCYQTCQVEEKKDQSKSFPQDGSTGTVCYITGDDVYVTNCGDSAAYSVMADCMTHTLLTEDHGTLNPSEVARCEKAGGRLQFDTYFVRAAFPMCCFPTKIVGKPRVYPGGLLVTRAFGDFHAKVEYLGGLKGVVVHDHGKIKYMKLTSGSSTQSTPVDSQNGGPPVDPASRRLQFLLIASDGVWDGLSVEEVLQIVRDEIRAPSDDSIASLVVNSQEDKDGGSVAGSSPGKKVPLNVVVPASSSGPTSSTPSSSAAQSSIVSQVRVMVSSGAINADVDAMDPRLARIARRICLTAVRSKKWVEYGSSADNTSCTVVEITHALAGSA